MGLGIQIASLFASIGVDPSGLNKGLASAKQSLSQFGGEMAKQVVGTVSLAAAVYKAGQTVVQSVRDWADYADGMRLASQMAGITTEEMSRLVQAADDFRVPMETMQRSMEMALKNGFVPTIENIAALSDELLGISDPALRAAKASQIFGKSYADMMPFLLAGGDAIRETTSAIDDNLIVTGRAAEEAKAYKDAVDALGDAWTGFKNKIGSGLVSGLADVINNLMGQPIELDKMLDDLYDKAFKAWATGKIAEDTYTSLLTAANIEPGQTWTSYYNELSNTLAYLDYVNGVTTNSTTGLTDAELEAAAAALAAAEAQAKMKDELLNVTSLDANYSGIIDLGYQFTDMLAEQETLQAERNKLLSQGWSEQSTKVKELTDNIAGLDADMKKMADQVTLDMFKATIAIGGVTQAELMAYMQMAIDMGYMSEEGAKAAVDAYSNAIGTINGLDIDEKTGNVEIDALAAFATLDLLQAYALKDKHAQAVMHVQFQYGTPAGEDYDQYDIGGYPTNAHGGGASGGYFMADTPYIVGERGPELFVPNANGQIIPNNELGGNSDLLGDILLELQNQPSRMKVAIKEAFALVGG
jgi:hypothetical protein